MNVIFNQKVNVFLKQVPLYSKKDLTIFYVYRNFSSFFQRDLEYFLSDPSVQVQKYQDGFVMTGKSVVCKTICQYYGRVFKRLHIDFKIITTNDKIVPHYGMIVHGDKGWYFIDPLKDLLTNQMGFCPHFFGVIPEFGTVLERFPYLKKLDASYVWTLARDIDSLFGGEYLDFYMNLIHEECFNSSLSNVNLHDNGSLTILKLIEKLEFVSNYLLNLEKVPGLFERGQYYSYLKGLLFNKLERKSLSIKIFNQECIQILVSCMEEELLYQEILNENGEYVLKRIR